MEIFLDLKLLDNNKRVFGNGILWLLKNIDKLGSIKKASEKMKMSYSKANKIINNAEKNLKIILLIRYKGGKNKGGANLTNEAKQIIEVFEKYKKKLLSIAEKGITLELENIFK